MTPDQFRKKGHGKIAPWVDLLNSEEWDTYGRRTDWLNDPSWLPFFLKQWQFDTPHRASFPTLKFERLREVLRKSCETIVTGRAVLDTELHELNAALNVTGIQQLIRRQKRLRLEFVPRSEGWDWILSEIASSFAGQLAESDGSRIKICQNQDCRWVFYDATKGKTRRWCSDKVCGNRERVRRARAKAAG